MTSLRKIIHVDMDAFYASVEQRDNPKLKGKPVVVGGQPDSRSVVAAASYEARKFGIRSAISCAQAYRLCPRAIFVPPRFDAYRDVSNQIMELFHEYTDLVEPLSLDEAYLDVTKNKLSNPSATRIAEEIRKKITERTALTASAGVAPNKFLAKVASDMNKPNGLTVIPPDKVEEILLTLPVRKVPGIGAKTEERLKAIGVELVSDLRRLSLEELQHHFGKTGAWFYSLARGEDAREVIPSRERKSVGAEDTFPADLLEWEALEEELLKIGSRVWRRLRGQSGRTVTLKVTYADFEKITRGATTEEPIQSLEQLNSELVRLLLLTEATRRPIRLLGASVSNFGEKERELHQGRQLTFPWW